MGGALPGRPGAGVGVFFADVMTGSSSSGTHWSCLTALTLGLARVRRQARQLPRRGTGETERSVRTA
ncbi:hypothetical protein FM106_06425 [Brachybacterium faecium]|nr:hypothetical protein FM106_06425 [Brachybacterium faecium]